jgi:hypothetical protein
LVNSTESGKEPNAQHSSQLSLVHHAWKPVAQIRLLMQTRHPSLWRWTSEVTEVGPVQIPTSCHNVNTKNQPNKRKERGNQQSISKTQNNKQPNKQEREDRPEAKRRWTDKNLSLLVRLWIPGLQASSKLLITAFSGKNLTRRFERSRI